MRNKKIILLCFIIIISTFIGAYSLVTGIKNWSDYTLKVTDTNRSKVLRLLVGDGIEVKENEELQEVRMRVGIPDGNVYILRYSSGETNNDFIDGREDSGLVEYIKENGKKSVNYMFIITIIILVISIHLLIETI